MNRAFLPRIYVLTLILAGCATTSAIKSDPDPDGSTLLLKGDELVRLYHAQPNASPMDPDAVVNALYFASSSKFYKPARNAIEEKDAFRSREKKAKVFEEFRHDSSQFRLSNNIAILTHVYIGPYDFNNKRFQICWGPSEASCHGPAPNLSQHLGAYELDIDLARISKFYFHPNEDAARRIEESLSSQPYGRVQWAVLYGSIDTVDQSKRIQAKLTRVAIKRMGGTKVLPELVPGLSDLTVVMVP